MPKFDPQPIRNHKNDWGHNIRRDAADKPEIILISRTNETYNCNT